MGLPAKHRASVLQVFIFRGGEFIGTDVFLEHQIFVGRDPDQAQLVLDSEEVSRQHARIEVRDGAVWITDLGSTNGVLLNENTVSGEVKVNRLDELIVGDYHLKLKLVPKHQAIEYTRYDTMPAPRTQLRVVGDLLERVSPDDAETISGRNDDGQAGLAPMAEESTKFSKPSFMRDPTEADMPHAHADVTTDYVPTVPTPQIQKRVEAKKVEAHSESSPKSQDNVTMYRDVDFRDSAKDAALGSREGQRIGGDRGGEFPADEASVFLSEPAPNDEEEDEADIEPAFSLRSQLFGEDAAVAASRHRASAIEVISYNEEAIRDVTLLRPGESMWFGPKVSIWRRLQSQDLAPRLRLVRFRRSGQCEVRWPERYEAMTSLAGQRHPAVGQKVRSLTASGRRHLSETVLNPGEVLDIVSGSQGFHVRFVQPPRPVRDPRPLAERLKPDRWTQRAFASSGLLHLAAIIVLAISSAIQPPPAPPPPPEEFLELEVEPPPEEPEPPKPPEPPKAPEPPKPKPKEPVKVKNKPKKPTPSPKPDPKRKPDGGAPTGKAKRNKPGGTSKGPPGILGALSKTGATVAPGAQSAVQALNNISSAKVPGARGGFRMSPLQGKLATSSLSAGGGGGGPLTKGGRQVLRGGAGGGAGAMKAGRGGGTIRGMVAKVPPDRWSRGGAGSLSMAEIQKVVNKHIGEIQRCYERELVRQPGMAGKVELEWIIAPSGGVQIVKQKFSSLGSSSAVSCMMGRVKGWRFPKPKGGSVIVAIPFNFRSTTF